MPTAVSNMFVCIVLACAVQIRCQSLVGTETTTAKGVPKSSVHLAKDYDYVDIGVNYKPTNTRQNTNTAITNTNPQSSVPNQLGSPTTAEKHEWLVSRLKAMKQRASLEQLNELQKLFPGINVTNVFRSLLARPREEDEAEGRAGFGNATHYKSEDEREAHYVNGTLQPGEGPEMDDAYYYNGTWYPGVREAEDGYYANGTWFPAPGENDEGYMLNGTWHEENEAEEAGGQGEEENEKGELMWWQLHHPKWRNGEVHEANSAKTAEHEKQQEKESGSQVPIVVPVPVPKNPNTFKQPNQEPQRPFASPQYQRPQHSANNQRPPISLPKSHSPAATQHRSGVPAIENKPIQAKMTGNGGSEPLAAVANSPLLSKGQHAAAGQQLPESSIVETIPKKGNSMSSTMTWGIVMACLIAFTFILAPLACILYKYRMEKRIKKRTFLKRPEHGSVDEGIMDAMVMSELGETNNSRVKVIGKKPSPRPKRDDRARDPSSRRSSTSSLSLSRLRHERRPLTMVEMGDGPEILIV